MDGESGDWAAWRLRLDAVFHAVALSFDDDDLRVMHDAVEQGAGQRGVVGEDGRPVLERLVGGLPYQSTSHSDTSGTTVANRVEDLKVEGGHSESRTGTLRCSWLPLATGAIRL
jgi:hypothetical protein